MNGTAASIATIEPNSCASAPFSSTGLSSTGFSSETRQSPKPSGIVLIVDDSRFNRIILKRQLQSIGCQVEQAKNGREALEQMGQQCFDFVLMDCQMPEMDGYEATRQLRQLEGDRPRTTIIALTANTQPGHKEICIASGMDGYLNKPISTTTLVTVVQQLLFGEPTGEQTDGTL